MSDTPAPPAPMVAGSPVYADEDMVYVDPEKRVVVGRVEWGKNGNPKPLQMPTNEKEEPPAPDAKDRKERGARRGRKAPRKRYYPWGTYRSMKRIYKIDGKPPKVEPVHTLEQVIDIAVEQPYW